MPLGIFLGEISHPSNPPAGFIPLMPGWEKQNCQQPCHGKSFGPLVVELGEIFGSTKLGRNPGSCYMLLQAQNIVDVYLFGSPRACSFGVSDTFLKRSLNGRWNNPNDLGATCHDPEGSIIKEQMMCPTIYVKGSKMYDEEIWFLHYMLGLLWNVKR